MRTYPSAKPEIKVPASPEHLQLLPLEGVHSCQTRWSFPGDCPLWCPTLDLADTQINVSQSRVSKAKRGNRRGNKIDYYLVKSSFYAGFKASFS